MGGTTNASRTVTDAQGYDLNDVSTAHGAQGIYIATIEGIVKPSASGTLAMRFKSDGDGTIVVEAAPLWKFGEANKSLDAPAGPRDATS